MPQNLKTEWSVQLYDGKNQIPITDDTGLAVVLTSGTGKKATLYSDALGTAITQPMTFRGGRIRFFTDSSVTSLGLSLITAKGVASYTPDLIPSQQRIVVWPDNPHSVLAMPYELNSTVTAAVTDTGLDLPSCVLVTDITVDALEAGGPTTASISVGTSAAPSGFLLAAGLTVLATGYKILSEGVSAFAGALISLTATNFATRIKYQATTGFGGSASSLVYAALSSANTVGSGIVYFTLQRLPSRA